MNFPVVTTAEEAIEYLKRGSGVGIELTGKTDEEAAAITAKVSQFQINGRLY
jgi:hypothetical protein